MTDNLDEVTRAIALLEYDERMCAVVNGLMAGCDGAVVNTITSLSQTMVTLAALIGDDGIKMQCAAALRDAASTFEEATLRMKALN